MNRILKRCVHFYRKTDCLLMALCLAASAVSVALIWGIYLSGYIQFRVVLVQIVATLLGVVCACVISLIDYRLLARMWKLYLPAAMLLVGLTYIVGMQRYSYIDDRAWLPIPFLNITFQPSEILKLALILSLALHLEKVQESINELRTLITLALHGGLLTLMIVAQGDDGTAMVFVAIFCFMLFAAGLDLRYVAAAAAAVAVASPLVWFFVLDDDKKNRFLSVFNAAHDPLGSGYQQGEGVMAIGSGQIWGKGVFSADHQYIPEMHNDFIFAVIGESTGFVGCLAVIALLAVLCLRLLLNAHRAKDPLGRYICVGVFAVISFQTLWGIGMCLSLLPVAGLTLPFLSAGGTSVALTYAAVGLALSVYRHSATGLFDR